MCLFHQSSVPIGCCTDYTGQASALWTATTTRRTRPGRRLTWPLARFFQNLQKWPKTVQKCPRVVQIHISSFLDCYPSFGSHHLYFLVLKNMCQPWVWGRDNFKLNSLLLRPFYNNGHGDGSDDFEPDFKRLVPEGRWRVIFERDCQQLPPFHCVSTKGVVLRKGNTGECNYTHSCFYQTLQSLVEVVIGDARKLDKCLCQFLLSPCASFKWFFTHEFKVLCIFEVTAVHQASHWQGTKSANCQLERHLLGPTWYATEKFQQYC